MPSFLARIYAFKFFDSFILIFPLYAVMFVDAGLNPFQIAIILTTWSATTFVLQAPAGAIADRLPRRRILAAAQLMRAACFVVWWIYPHFWGFLIGLMLWGVKSAFTNGVFEALLFDELKAKGQAPDYTRIFGRARAVQAAGVIAASLGAAAVARFGYGAALAASLVSITLAIGAALTFPPAARAVASGELGYLAHLRQGVGLAIGQPLVLSILVFAALTNAMGAALEEFWPVFGAQVSLPRPTIALFVGAQNTVEALAAMQAHRFSRLAAGWFYLAFASAGGLLLTAAGLFTAPAMALLAAYSGLMKLTDTVWNGRLQQAIPSENRATIGGVKELAAQIGVSSLYMGFGPLAQATSYRMAFMACGAAAILIGLSYMLLAGRRQEARP
ncbi:MAG TPA: MFS transporter [Caulobacteraceae bacterium]|jgi:MFS family permease|nr:MFS transporter [Caulobacteraceae bacterium]